ncbi:MAG: hypothetical protein K8R65_03625 [Nitrospirae bacterium]|nr:hypothetical protein [Nitrospirota bacterium]
MTAHQERCDRRHAAGTRTGAHGLDVHPVMAGRWPAHARADSLAVERQLPVDGGLSLRGAAMHPLVDIAAEKAPMKHVQWRTEKGAMYPRR